MPKKTFKCPEILTLLRKLCCPVHKDNVHQSTSVSDPWSVLAGAFRIVSREKHNAVQKQRNLWLCKKQWAIELLNQKLTYPKVLLVAKSATITSTACYTAVLISQIKRTECLQPVMCTVKKAASLINLNTQYTDAAAECWKENGCLYSIIPSATVVFKVRHNGCTMEYCKKKKNLPFSEDDTWSHRESHSRHWLLLRL